MKQKATVRSGVRRWRAAATAVAGIAALVAGFEQQARSQRPVQPPSTGVAKTMDCTGSARGSSNGSCPELKIRGDAPDRSGFHGFADPSLREDPTSHDLYMSYSYPHHLGDSGTNTIEIHLAKSTDKGNNWSYVGPLFNTRPVTNSGASAYAAESFTSNEVLDILPVKQGGSTMWYTARLVYLVGKGQMFPYMQILPTSYIAIAVAPTTEDLPNLANMKEARLGERRTDASMRLTLNLADVHPDLAPCFLFNEPSLAYQQGTLYLAMSCTAVTGGGGGMRPNGARTFFAMLSTRPVGTDPTVWKWKYVGAFAKPEDAKALGQQEGRNYDSFTQLEFARNGDGTLLAILNPQARGATRSMGARQNRESHFGCRVFEMGPNLDAPSLVKGESGAPVTLARVDATDLYGGGNAGTGSCSYDAASATGIVMARKYMRDPVQGFYSTLNITHLHP